MNEHKTVFFTGMISGIGSGICCQVVKAVSGLRPKTTACLSRLSCIGIARVWPRWRFARAFWILLCDPHAPYALYPPEPHRKDQRPYDQEMYKWRHLVENMFQKIKQLRAIETRYDKTAAAFLGGIQLAAMTICLN